MIFVNRFEVSYIRQTSPGWALIEVIDTGNQEVWTVKIGHHWNLAVDPSGNVFAVYLAPEIGWRINIRSAGPGGKWSGPPSLPAEANGYCLAADSNGKVHVVYGAGGKLRHNWIALAK